MDNTNEFKRIGWNKFETALLIEAYEDAIHKRMTRQDACVRLSKRLRSFMIKKEPKISEKYRNVNGISMQMAVIEYCLTGGQKGFCHPTKIFQEITTLYQESKGLYDVLLKEAHQLYPDIDVQKCDNGMELTLFTDVSLYDSKQLEQIENVLTKSFKKGFRLESKIELKRFRLSYESIYNIDIDVSDDNLIEIIKYVGITINNKVYLPKEILDNGTRDSLVKYIDEVLDSGQHYLHYEVIYKHFRDCFINSLITDEGMLMEYLQHTFEKKWQFNDKYLSMNENPEVDIDGEVIKYVKEQGRVVTEDEVVKAFPNLPSEMVKNSFSKNTSLIISNGSRQKFHIDSLLITDKELNSVVALIETAVNRWQFISGSELYKDIKSNIPSLLKNNEDLTELGIRNSLACKLKGKFSFNNAVISRIGSNLTATDAILSYVRSHNCFTLKEIDNLASSLGTVLNYHLEKMMQYSIRIDDNNFISRKDIKFNSIEIDKAISKTCTEYDSLRSIKNFSLFPDIQYDWNVWILENYLVTSSEQYILIHGESLGKNDVTGAIVSKGNPLLLGSNSKIFDEVLAQVLVKNNIELSEKVVLDFLMTEGYISQPRFGKMEKLLANALELKNRLLKK